jgi:hypothetical protein
MYLFREFNVLYAALAILLWTIAGWLMTARTFRLEKIERTLVAVSVGIVVNIWLANLAAQFLPQPLAFWLSTGFAILAGLALAWPLNRELLETLPGNWKHWLVFIIIAYVLTLVGRGLAIYDDYHSLASISLMATGDVPPHFPLDPDISYGYHYFLLMFCTQFVQMTRALPWTSIDLARGITLALTLLLGGLWTRRLTGSRWAGFTAVLFLFFAAGMRWILLLIPRSLLDLISSHITFYGAAISDAGGSIANLLVKTRGLEGAGVFEQPYFLLNGLDNPFVLALGNYGTMPVLLILLLLLLADHRSNWRGTIITAILVASLALANEVTFAFLYAGLVIAFLIWIIRNRREKPFKKVWPEIITFTAAGLAAILQGGMFTSILYNRLTPGASMAFDISFKFGVPSFFNAHFGSLSLFNPAHWILILADSGPMLLLLPVLIVWGVRAARRQEWMAAGIALSALVGLLATTLTYTGNVATTATTRFTSHLLTMCKLFAIVLVWNWAAKRSEVIKQGLVGLGLAASLAGMAIFALQIASAQTPQYSYFLTRLDGSMYEKYWNKLEPDALVFDFENPSRAITVLGRFSSLSRYWDYRDTERWDELIRSPDPYSLRAAGFSYVYLGEDDLAELDETALMQSACVKEVDKVQDNYPFRSLLDIRNCINP